MLQFIWPGQPMEFVSCDCHILNSSGSYVIALAETDEAKLKKTGVLKLGTENRVLRLHERDDALHAGGLLGVGVRGEECERRTRTDGEEF